MASNTRNKELTKEVLKSIDLLTKIELLPGNRKHDALVRQLIRCSASIGTDYETDSHSKSVGGFINKLKKQEIDNEKASKKLEELLVKGTELISIYSNEQKV